MAKFETQGVLSIVIRYFCQIWIRKFPFILAEEHDQLYISRKFRIFQKSDVFIFNCDKFRIHHDKFFFPSSKTLLRTSWP